VIDTNNDNLSKRTRNKKSDVNQSDEPLDYQSQTSNKKKRVTIKDLATEYLDEDDSEVDEM